MSLIPTQKLDTTRHGRITPDNHGPYVVVASYIMMCMMMLLVITRLITKYLTIRNLRLDDFSIIAAAVRHLPRQFLCLVPMLADTDDDSLQVLAVIQSILVQQAVDSGLGQHRVALSDAQFDAYSQVSRPNSNVFNAILMLEQVQLCQSNPGDPIAMFR